MIDLRRESSATTDKGTSNDIVRKEGNSVLDDDDEKGEFQRLATELVRALEEYGFVTLVNHGISPEAIRAAFGASRRFFSLDGSEKNKYAYRGHDRNCGYIGVGQESHAAASAEGKSPAADFKETFDIGPEPNQGDAPGCGGEGGTPWPGGDEDGLGERFKSVLVSYFEECNRLQLHLLKLIAVGLGLPSSDFLAAQCDERHCNLRLLRYPPLVVKGNDGHGNAQPRDESVAVVRGARHTDFGTLTLLAQDDVGGLRVQPRSSKGGADDDGAWIHVAPVEGALVLNVGDMLQRWTNDRLVATPHQVVSVANPHRPMPNRTDDPDAAEVWIPERYSIAFFCNANKDTVLRPIPCLVRASDGPKYEAVTAKEYLTRRLTETIRPTA